ncbi:hypothetical protein [Microbulbifer sp. NBRC 101763]|uniref:hypothetical protein n=2 Tax=unclassified Microbulbifer TaxID=2619833 RepID=UPI00333EB44C
MTVLKSRKLLLKTYNKAIKYVPAKKRPPPDYLRVASASVYGGIRYKSMYVEKLVELNLLCILNQCRYQAYEIRTFHEKYHNQLGEDEVIFRDAVCQLSTLKSIEEALARHHEKLPIEEAELIMTSLYRVSSGFSFVSKLKYEFLKEHDQKA